MERDQHSPREIRLESDSNTRDALTMAADSIINEIISQTVSPGYFALLRDLLKDKSLGSDIENILETIEKDLENTSIRTRRLVQALKREDIVTTKTAGRVIIDVNATLENS